MEDNKTLNRATDTTREMQQANNRQRITIGNLRQQLRQQRNRVAILMEEREGGAA